MSFYSNFPAQGNDNSTSLYPTIYEPISANEIDSLLPSSVRYIITNYWISRYPNWYSLQVNNYFDEWFNLGLKGLVEWFHLNKYNSTFIEKFYGLQKFNSDDKVLLNAFMRDGSDSKEWPIGLQLTKLQKRVLFFEKIILPYISNKLDECHEKLAAVGQELPNTHKSINEYIKIIFKKLYPIFKRCFQLLNLLIKLRFLAGKSGSLTVIEHLFKISYTRALYPLESTDIQSSKGNIQITENRLERQNYFSMKNSVNMQLNHSLSILSYMGSKVFPTFLFILRIYQWWTTEDISSKIQRKINNIDKYIPRPPISKEELTEKGGSTQSCPVCEDEIQNPCVLETGYVLCYPCALEYIPQHEGKCPVTGKKLLGCEYDNESKEWKIVNGVRRLLV